MVFTVQQRDEDELLEKLTAIAKSKKNKKYIVKNKKTNDEYSDGVKFLVELKITNGDIKVKTSSLYSSYNGWSNDPLSKKEFIKETENLLVAFEDSFGLNKSIWEIDERIFINKLSAAKKGKKKGKE